MRPSHWSGLRRRCCTRGKSVGIAECRNTFRLWLETRRAHSSLPAAHASLFYQPKQSTNSIFLLWRPAASDASADSAGERESGSSGKHTKHLKFWLWLISPGTRPAQKALTLVTPGSQEPLVLSRDLWESTGGCKRTEAPTPWSLGPICCQASSLPISFWFIETAE